MGNHPSVKESSQIPKQAAFPPGFEHNNLLVTYLDVESSVDSMQMK